MKLIIGLGNPGKQYENTRHNAGFIILDELRNILSFDEFTDNKKFEAKVSEGKIKGTKSPIGDLVPESKIMLAKPQTFMNLSGKSVKAIMDFYKIALHDLIVVHDDLDIDFGNLKVSQNSSAAGHNGVQSIVENIGTQEFKRIRIGIEGAEKKKERIIPGDVFVLQNFSDEELQTVKNLSTEVLKNL